MSHNECTRFRFLCPSGREGSSSLDRTRFSSEMAKNDTEAFFCLRAKARTWTPHGGNITRLMCYSGWKVSQVLK